MAKKVKSISEIVLGIPKDVAPETKIEKINPLYFNLDKLKQQPEPLYRLDSKNHRYYYRFSGDEPVFYTSVTTLIKNTLPTSPFLISWLISKQGTGAEEALERAFYGTFLHAECSNLLINGKYDLEKLPERLESFSKQEDMPVKKGWADELKKDMLAFAQFVIDKNVTPLAIEICLYHPDDGYAGALDLVCELDFNRKRITAIIDLKSGKKGFYESHEIQLGAYRDMWQIHFPDTPIDKLFNLSPKAWKKSPTYELKDQTGSPNIPKLPYLVELSKIEADKRDDTFTIVSGEINLSGDLTNNYSEKTLIELVKENK